MVMLVYQRVMENPTSFPPVSLPKGAETISTAMSFGKRLGKAGRWVPVACSSQCFLSLSEDCVITPQSSDLLYIDICVTTPLLC